MKNVAKKISAGFLSVLLLLALPFATGCTGLLHLRVQSIAFTESAIELCVGERTDLNRYVSFMPNRATNKRFTVKSSDETVVRVQTQIIGGVTERYAVGVSTGTATLTAVSEDGGKTAALGVTVTYALPDGVAIDVTGELAVIENTVILQATNIVPVILRVELPSGIDPNTLVSWKAVSGTNTIQSDTLSMSETFTFTPYKVGQTAITAEVTGKAGQVFSDTLRVNVYDAPTYARVSYTGLLTQEAGRYSSVCLSADYAYGTADNPSPVIQWFVNGAATGTGDTFFFTPTSPGVYILEGKLNGQTIYTDTGTSVTVTVRGTVVPRNVYVDYDNCYPKVFIRWDTIPAAAGYEVIIVNKDTGRTLTNGDFSTENTAVRDTFTDCGVDATAYFTDASTVFNTRFGVRVKTLGDGKGVFTESPWSTEYIHEKVDVRAKEYLNDTFYDGARNRYVRSYEEFYEWFEYAMLWRPSSLTEGEKLYLDYVFSDAQEEIANAMQQMHFTGLYSYSGENGVKNKKECTFIINFRSDATPSRKTTRHTNEAWNALRPHVNYNSSKARSAKYVFPIDVKTPVTVTTSDQLYYVTQLGYRPVPESGSVAERLYNYARRTLRYIITDDMSDVEKLHAIYDWIMWRVIYDNEVLRYTGIAESVRYESYYLESVLTDTGAYGVCDAMSKAFVLLCGIEGFESVRVTGMAGTGNNMGGHAWNKVKLNGNWYAVDCTWGDASVQLTEDGAYRESAAHLYFLVADADIASTHTEDENGVFPATAAERYPWYAESFAYDGGKIDFYLDGKLTTVGLRNEIDTLVRYMADEKEAARSVFSVGPDTYVNRSNTDYYACEFVADGVWGDGSRLSTFRSTLENKLALHGLNKHHLIFQKMGEQTHVVVFLPL